MHATHEICEPEDQTPELKAEIAGYLDTGKLREGVDIPRLSILASYSGSKPGRKTRRVLNLDERADWHDAIHEIDRRLRNPDWKAGQDTPAIVIDATKADPGSGQFDAVRPDHVRREHAARKRKLLVQQRQSDEAAPAETEASPDVSEWRKCISGEQ